jgi:hypothetical protein
MLEIPVIISMIFLELHALEKPIILTNPNPESRIRQSKHRPRAPTSGVLKHEYSESGSRYMV